MKITNRTQLSSVFLCALLINSVFLPSKPNLMENFKKDWQITKNWQLLFPALGIVALLLSGFLMGKLVLKKYDMSNPILLGFLSFFIAYILLNLTLKIFTKLEYKWNINNRWELIAIFLVFSVTGSLAARLSSPVTELIGIQNLDNKFLFWVIRILIIYPIYQILLVGIGWLFGQFTFFWAFEKKMLKRMGFKRFFKEN